MQTQVIVTDDAKVLKPNNAHKNFTETPEVIKKGSKINGEIKIVEGLRKGLPFKYRIFTTTDKKIIYLNKTKPMEKTEVTLGADSAQTPTVVKLPSTSAFKWKPVLGTAVGLFLAYKYSKKKGYTGTKKYIHLAIGGGVGFGLGYFWQTKTDVTVKPSK